MRRNESLRAGLLESLKRWNDGEVDVLWAEACKLYASGARQVATSLVASNIRRATECAQDAYGKAVSSLLSLGTCPVTEETLKEMKSKHPEALPPTLPVGGLLPEAVRFDTDLVRKKVDGFPAGSAAGASGTRPQFLKDILACPNKAAGADALTSLTIAIGETVRRLVSKCCCEATTEEAKVIFGPLQAGVATQGGAEASVHAVRKLAQEFGDDPARSCSRWISQTLSTWWIVP